MSLDTVANAAAVTRLRAEFAATWGGRPRVFFAPGRVNLVGAHLDYSGGDVLPLAVDRGIYVAARLRDDGRLRLRSLDQDLVVELDAAAVGAHRDSAHGWAGYPLGVWREFQVETGGAAGSGCDLLYSGDVPMASGLSSSAAIEVATAVALDALTGASLSRQQLASLSHRAETGYVGIKCGIMDQFASALGRAGHALLLHCAPPPRFEHVPLDPGAVEVLVMDTRRPRHLASSHFNRRVQECAEAHAMLRAAGIDRPYLAAYTAADLDRAGAALTGVHLRRARHVVSEMQRVAGAVAGLRRGDIGALGRALDESHESARVDYEVSCPELDVITEAARRLPHVSGARLTGAGFGGCGIALVRPGFVAEVSAAVRERFVAAFGVEPGFDVLHAGPGPCEIAD